MKTKLQEIEERMTAIKDKETKELQELEAKKREFGAQISSAKSEMDEAAKVLDLKAYEKAKSRYDSSKTAFDMYAQRLSQFKEQGYVSEAENEEVISEILTYEAAISEDFKSDIMEPLRRLREIEAAYFAEVEHAEIVLTKWQEIYPNYKVQNCQWKDPETGQMTNRSKTPVPIHATPFTGCSEAQLLHMGLSQMKDLARGQ